MKNHDPDKDIDQNTSTTDRNLVENSLYKDRGPLITSGTMPSYSFDEASRFVIPTLVPRNSKIFLFNTSEQLTDPADPTSSFLAPILITPLDTEQNPLPNATTVHPWQHFAGPFLEGRSSYVVDQFDRVPDTIYQIESESIFDVSRPLLLQFSEQEDTTPPDAVSLDIRFAFRTFGVGSVDRYRIVDEYTIALSPSAQDDFSVAYFEIDETIDGVLHDHLIVPLQGRFQIIRTKDPSYSPHERCYDTVAVDLAGNRSETSHHTCITLDRTSGCTQTTSTDVSLLAVLALLFLGGRRSSIASSFMHRRK